jgi:hypothetical protein
MAGSYRPKADPTNGIKALQNSGLMLLLKKCSKSYLRVQQP